MSVELVGFSPLSLLNVGSHSHQYWEIVLNLEGTGTTSIGDRELPFYPGTIVCQPPNSPHAKTSKDRFRDIYIQASGFIIPTHREILTFQDDEEKSFETLMYHCLRTFHKKDANYMAVVQSLYDCMQQILLGWVGSKRRNTVVELFKNDLINHFTDPDFRLSDAFRKTAYCTDYFRRCFKEETGSTPNEYLTQLRMEYSRKLLMQKKETGMTIAEIAYRSGFYDQHYFSRVFKNKTGETPQEYVKNYSLR